MPKAHQAEGVIFVLGAGHTLINARFIADFIQHFQYRLVGTAVRRPPKGCYARGNTGEGVGPGGACKAHSGR